MKRWTWLVGALAGCGVDGADALVADTAPPPPLTLAVEGPWFRGDVVDARMFITAPNGSVRLYASRSATPPGACPAWLAPVCLDLRAPGVIGAVTASPTGIANLSFTVPPTAPEGAVLLQAAARSGAGRQKSSVQTVHIYERGGDFDGDGLRNDDEVEVFGTDPESADSDGGGVSDGDEVDAGSSPLSSADDGQQGGDCLIDFAWGYATAGQGASPTMYGPHGVSFDVFTFGMVGGGVFGDPGGWNAYGGAPDEALSARLETNPHSLLFADPTPYGSFRVGAVSGGDFVLDATAYLGLREVWTGSVLLGLNQPNATFTVPGLFDRIRLDSATPGFHSYVIDDVAYQTTVPTVCAP